ncbi:NUDIX hydrolase [Lapidilactobacillus mulanensis]|uniref:NUDIX hydrolase n=1 Tax=Lapidilactobacillus mulanensis TaxID=2485999 RepID=A0ABW4DLT6_9LACO|nr:NUDIX domain-containing protein [Lapidilactobacillus mulanensis]
MANYIKEIRTLVGHKPIILVAVGGYLLNDQNQILLQERADTYGWGIPGGFMEYGETLAETCAREFEEDSGVKVKVGKFVGYFDHDFFEYPNGDQAQVIGNLFEVQQIGGSPLTHGTDETLSTKWFDLDHTPPMYFAQNQKMIDLVKTIQSTKS